MNLERKPTILLTEKERESIYHRFPNLPVTVEEWSKRFHTTPEEVKAIASVAQGTPEWLEFRKYRITGSVYGTAVGENPYKNQTPKDLISDMLYFKEMDERGKANCKWGNDHEDDACEAYEEYMRYQKGLAGDTSPFWVDHYGLDVHPDEPWSGDSKDGVVNNVNPDGTVTQWLLEIKCPTRDRQGKWKLYDHIPSQYYTQIQGIMGYNNLPFCDFVVWNPDAMLIERYYFDKKYYDWFRTEMQKWYVLEFAPRAIMKDYGLFKDGQIDYISEINVEDHKDEKMKEIDKFLKKQALAKNIKKKSLANSSKTPDLKDFGFSIGNSSKKIDTKDSIEAKDFGGSLGNSSKKIDLKDSGFSFGNSSKKIDVKDSGFSFGDSSKKIETKKIDVKDSGFSFGDSSKKIDVKDSGFSFGNSITKKIVDINESGNSPAHSLGNSITKKIVNIHDPEKIDENRVFIESETPEEGSLYKKRKLD